jgi:transporter family-2 protein
MNTSLTITILMAAGAALVIQNLLMVRISEAVSTVIITLVINSSVGLVLLIGVLLVRNGVSGIIEAVGAFRPWAVLPGLLGSFFVFASIAGYQKVGAATTIAVLVASQLIAGLAADALKADTAEIRPSLLALVGVVLLIVGAFLVARERV